MYRSVHVRTYTNKTILDCFVFDAIWLRPSYIPIPTVFCWKLIIASENKVITRSVYVCMYKKPPQIRLGE